MKKFLFMLGALVAVLIFVTPKTKTERLLIWSATKENAAVHLLGSDPSRDRPLRDLVSFLGLVGIRTPTFRVEADLDPSMIGAFYPVWPGAFVDLDGASGGFPTPRIKCSGFEVHEFAIERDTHYSTFPLHLVDENWVLRLEIVGRESLKVLFGPRILAEASKGRVIRITTSRAALSLFYWPDKLAFWQGRGVVYHCDESPQ